MGRVLVQAAQTQPKPIVLKQAEFGLTTLDWAWKYVKHFGLSSD